MAVGKNANDRTDWQRQLSRPLRTRGGESVETLSDARAYILALPEARQHRNTWIQAAELLLAAAAGGDVRTATDQFELALFLDTNLDTQSR
jgi:type VI protein secretion system component VasF